MPERPKLSRGAYQTLRQVCFVVVAAAAIVQALGASADEPAIERQKKSVAQALRERSGDGYAKVNVFGVEGTGNKFIYLFDRSASMEGAPLANAKRQLVESLKSLDEVHQFHIIFFNHRLQSFTATPGGPRIAFATDRNKKLAGGFLGRVKADGGTDRFLALKHALALHPDTIFFLSDADDPMSDSEMAKLARINEDVGAAICVIEFGRDPDKPERNFLTELARQSGGRYGYVDVTKLKP
jgi:hypothetical protein